MLLWPPPFTLFPYTTLFRSYALSTNNAVYPASGGSNQFTVTTLLGCPWSASSSASWIQIAAGASGNLKDRKSTRLNSSHQIISYAVFCLQKKNADPPWNNVR